MQHFEIQKQAAEYADGLKQDEGEAVNGFGNRIMNDDCHYAYA
ncbi:MULTISPECIES: hypothetical protein [Neisseria]|jgi:hypothetical protein|nr:MULTISPECIES: hypothetical protein [Neisseria]